MKYLKFAALYLAAICLSATAHAVLINEIQPNPTGADPTSVQLELLGTAFSSFDGYLLSVETDSAGGTIDRASTISGVFDPNGLLTVNIPDLENPSFTLILVDTFTGTVGMDIDVDNDGIIDDFSSFGTVFDAIGVPDSTADAAFGYGAQLGGLDFSYTGDEPQLIFRDSVTLDWFAINDPAGTQAFDLMGTGIDFSNFDMDPSMTTFGAINPTVVPVPAAIWLFASALGAISLRRKQKS